MAGIAIPLAISGISALGGLFSNRPKTTTETSRGTTSTSGTTSEVGGTTTTPNLDPATADYLNLIRNRYIQSLNQDVDLSGYEAGGVQNINRASGLRSQALNSILAARGLNYSPMGAAANAGLESARVSDVVGFQNQIPLLRNQLMQEKLNNAAAFFSRIPIGQTSTSDVTRNVTGTETREGTTTGTQPGNMLGGLFGGLGSSLAYLYGSGAFGAGARPNISNVAQQPAYVPYGGMAGVPK